MVLYNVLWKRSAVKELRNLPKDTIKRIYQVVAELPATPFPLGARKLVGSEHSYRLRVGDYRVIYSVQWEILTIEIIRVGHRKDVYK